MKMTDTAWKILFMTLAICSAALLLFSYCVDTGIDQLNAQLDREKLKNEALLSEKLSIEKSFVSSQRKLTALKFSQESLSKKLSLTATELKHSTDRNTLLKGELDHTNFQLRVAQAQRDSLLEEVVNANDQLRINHDTSFHNSLQEINNRYEQLFKLLERDSSLEHFFISGEKRNHRARKDIVSY